VLDRDDEVLLPEGLISSEFEKNPVVFWNHAYDKPIGQCQWLRRLPDAWLARTVLAERPENHQGEWLPDTVLSLVQQGVVRGVSVGFLPVMTREPSSKDREQFGPQVRRVITRWRMLEFSVTPLPANHDALILAVAKGVISQSACDALIAGQPSASPVKARQQLHLFLPAGKATQTLDTSRLISDAIHKKLGRLYG
jgi:HK97 family phage prohead protease